MQRKKVTNRTKFIAQYHLYKLKTHTYHKTLDFTRIHESIGPYIKHFRVNTWRKKRIEVKTEEKSGEKTNKQEKALHRPFMIVGMTQGI